MSRVLIVEDQIPVLLVAESILQQAGHDTLSAGTVAEAQAVITNPDENLDLIFTDIELHNRTDGGITLGQQVAEARRGTPVLYTSGLSITATMRSLFTDPSAFLPKPYTQQELTEGVAKLLRQ